MRMSLLSLDMDLERSLTSKIQRGIMNDYVQSRKRGRTALLRAFKRQDSERTRSFEEDGIILYVLSMIGFKNQTRPWKSDAVLGASLC